MSRGEKRRPSSREEFKRQNSQALQNLTHEMINEFREVFHLFDADGDQSIDVTELGTAMRSLGQNPTEEEVEGMIREVDQDGSGAIDFQEFLILMSQQVNDSAVEAQLRDAFAAFDRDGDGYITVKELKEAIYELIGEKLTENEAKDVCYESSFDTDADGRISFEEFVEFMAAMKDTDDR